MGHLQIDKHGINTRTTAFDFKGNQFAVFGRDFGFRNGQSRFVAVVAEDYQADAVFSFDGWYRTMGLKLVSDIAQTG